MTKTFARLTGFFKHNWKGLAVTGIATIIFFLPVIIRINSYIDGGDAMFNAWTLARDQHCILGEGCPDYSDGNIYFPNQDSMLYSETQLSAGLVTLPLRFISTNPIFSFNVLTIVSVFLSGFFMYLLAKYLSKGKELIPIFAGLIFMFAPLKIVAMGHLQNLSIFCLPLAVLLILKYLERRSKNYLWLLLVVLLYQFYASWYQMVFVLFALGALLLGMLVLRAANWRKLLVVGAVIAAACLATLPLAREYVRFSKNNKAAFGVLEQTLYSSSVADYFIPYKGTLEGRLYYSIRDKAHINAYNHDSYSYAGLVLYAVAGALIVAATIVLFRRRGKQADRQVIAFSTVGLVGLVASFGPLLQLKGEFLYTSVITGVNVAIPMPYIIIDKFVPQLHFIRAIGRISVVFLFALCCLLAYLPHYLNRTSLSRNKKLLILGAVVGLIIFELMPTHLARLSPQGYAFNHKVPGVYKLVRNRPEIDNLVVLRSFNDYPKAPFPVARAEDVLWAGYHNKNIFNGYSGYEPPAYARTYADFVDFKADDIAKMKKLGLRYVLVDVGLSSPNSQLVKGTHNLLGQPVYKDSRHVLFKL